MHLKSFSCVSSGQVWKLLGKSRINFYFWHSQEVDLQSSIRTRRGQTNTLLFLTFTGNTIFLEGPCLVNTFISSDKISTVTLISKLDFQFCLNICRKISCEFKLLLIKNKPISRQSLKIQIFQTEMKY